MSRILEWLLSDLRVPQGIGSRPEKQHTWWRVMCLTGVDYFSTLGYQPGIAFLAAGVLSPFATLVLILVTLFGALPIYCRVAAASSYGQGSIAMLENLFPKWSGKIFVLVLLGFATTDFIITMTLSAADAAAHFVQNPFTPSYLRSQMGVTLFLLLLLGAVFLKGFQEAIGIAVVIVGIYLGLNVVVTVVGLWQVFEHPQIISNWTSAIFVQHGNPLLMLGLSLVLFPKLALGLSGFETGVAVMPLIEGSEPEGRIRNTKKLLLTAAGIMSVFLLATSVVSTLLIEPAKFREGGEANGRAVAYLGHYYLGNAFGTVYDFSTILILAFAGASAMAGLLNLIPRYLPRFGMAPEWARASRPLVLVFLVIAIAVTFLFHANVDAQGGAYATGVLVLITSAAVAVTISVWNSGLRWAFLAISAVFAYTTAANIVERPEGIKIASVFIAAIILTSIVSRSLRSTELRITGIKLDQNAEKILAEDNGQAIRLVARRAQAETERTLDEADAAIRRLHALSSGERIYFFEVDRGDSSDFEDVLHVSGKRMGSHIVFCAKSPVIANAFAAMLIFLEQHTGRVPHAYFGWAEGNPIGNLLEFLLLGEGDIAPLTHEVLRRAIPEPDRRPCIHVS